MQFQLFAKSGIRIFKQFYKLNIISVIQIKKILTSSYFLTSYLQFKKLEY